MSLLSGGTKPDDGGNHPTPASPYRRFARPPGVRHPAEDGINSRCHQATFIK
jgi:hypothetical protein